jgi:hypothetical protein
MPEVTHIVALSGGKDSTAMALWLKENEPRDYTYMITPTGNELPEMVAFWDQLECLLGKALTRIGEHTLKGLIQLQGALPNHRMRWCTRMLKIEPAIEFYRQHAPCIAYVGLRADEDADERKGIYGIEIEQRYPLREIGWTVDDVWFFLNERGIRLPKWPNCGWCYDRRLSEWRELLQYHPDVYADGEAQEAAIGHTFRSPSRDDWPASLTDLKAEFQRGRMPRGADDQLKLWDQDKYGRCRVCSL